MNRTFSKACDPAFWLYLLGGAWRRLIGRALCPCCSGVASRTIDRKLFHSLLECAKCGVLHRYPVEHSSEMAEFYQTAYDEPGFASEVPEMAVLQRLLAENFRGSSKDFSRQVEILHALGLKNGQSLLDFGSSWGYAIHQFRQAGFVAEGFELSRPRAAFGRQIGLEITSEPPGEGRQFDMVYSCHVLEHVPNPLATLRRMLQWVKPGGWVVAQTPNGSQSFRQADPVAFHRLWGRVHPFLLTGEFVSRCFPDYPCYVSCDDRPEVVQQWNQVSRHIGDLRGSNLFFVIVNSPSL